ncbi:GTP cyclohydrolase 1 type 2 [Weizmannia acidilactici]|uniref:GTP cyclohydrolase 1 type 2 homolog n=1 Tax=Weizmannia acidilactici TaxID=2607726 RepID=A0A5J4JG25_9BACI|nr:Nif3-like dinuclear metal center hexameric protein [Weizmannia acidilactici]GER66922.1 GTP cyclohydrolase 1 type 2 [Weizmannia acidilactici]GER69575.1 GTP cyclohydrolase 1 type 2 [Weizmannia acidilactici]GER72748.1 GTP cyclohydrolase 1 type 2 [Weizmannia acidilactici]
MKNANGHEVIQLFEQFAPKKYAMEGDPVGLQIGQLNRPVKNVLVALDVIEDVVDEAIENDVQLIIAHHPTIYRPLKNVATDTPQGRLVEKCIRHGIAVYAAHTNLDVAPGGVNDLLAEALGLCSTEILSPTYEDKLRKLVVYVPVSHEEKVRTAIGNAGAGAIGAYSHCSFSVRGTGRFLPGEGTNPFLGKVGELEETEEVRVETIYTASIEKQVLQAMFRTHPYEEVAYDIYPVENEGTKLGLGRIGELEKEMALWEFAEHVKKALDVKALRVVGNLEDKVKKVAVLGGDGNKYFSRAKRAGADVFVTGDFYYHNAHDALAMGLNVIDPGHNVEKVMKKGVANYLQKACGEKGLDVRFIESKVNTDPFRFL